MKQVFKSRFGVQKSHKKTKQDYCGTSGRFNENCLYSISLSGYVRVQIIEQVYSEDPSKIEEML